MPDKAIITLATQNAGKQKELAHWVKEAQLPLQLVLPDELPDVEETGQTFLENALLKAKSVQSIAENGWVLAEDSGLMVEALEGLDGLSPFPGLYSNRWLTLARRDALLGQAFSNVSPLERLTENGVSNRDLCYAILKLMEGQTNRSAAYCCGMVLWQPKTARCLEFYAETRLWIIDEPQPRGDQGFGYDPIMTLPELKNEACPQTMAEFSISQKNAISHRGKAFQAIIQKWQSLQ